MSCPETPQAAIEAAELLERVAREATDLIRYLTEEADYLRTGFADGEYRGLPDAIDSYLKAMMASRENEVKRFAADALSILHRKGKPIAAPPKPF